jgi:hypothetical protein
VSLALLIAVWLPFGRITTDLAPVAAALDNGIASLQGRNYRVVRALVTMTDARRNPIPFEPDESVHIHTSSPAGHYFSSQLHAGSAEVNCFTGTGSFQCSQRNGTWTLRRAIRGNDPGDRYRMFAQQAFNAPFGLFHHPLSRRLLDEDYETGCLRLDRNRSVIWGRVPLQKNESSVAKFQAVVRFSDDRTMAFFERADSHYESNSSMIDSVTITRAAFAGKTLEFHAAEETLTYFTIRKEWDSAPRFMQDNTYQYRITANTGVTVSDDQLTPEYYGVSRRALLKALADRDPTLVPATERYDQVLAFLIPAGLLGVLYLLIRKT